MASAQRIPLSRGLEAIVDESDYEWLSRYSWFATTPYRGHVYAARMEPTKNGQVTVLMHREILNAPGQLVVDHVNGSGLDNRKANLRLCTHAQNIMNQRPQRGCSSVYRGVYWHKGRSRWVARLKKDGREIFVGRFTEEKEAARAWNEAALEHFGEFARLNPV